MFIHQLEIDNFKSFGKKTKIPFYEGFTVISGPNGSGKSNIIDSILFCLALSGARGLRAEKLTDLINLNSGKNAAEVTITFSDGTTIRRRIKRTSHGYYSYNYLNDRLCKQGDVLEFLTKFGIKPEGYNVVMQGDITRIMEMSDVERRRIIDEIAGVADFDKKKEQALAELEVVRERIDREEILLHELHSRLDELKTEREHALRFRKLQDHLDFLRSCRSAAELHERERELSALEELIKDQNAARTHSDEEQQKEKGRIEEQHKKVQEVDEEINEKSGTEYLHLLSQLEEAKGEIRLAEQTISRRKEEKKVNLETIQRIYMDKKRAETRVKENSDTIRNLTIDRSNIAMELATKKAELGTLEEKLQAESAEVEGAKDQLFAQMKDLEEQKAKRSELLREQDMLIERSRMRTSEKERLENRRSLLEKEYDEKAHRCQEYASQIVQIEEEKSGIEREISRIESELFACRTSAENLRKEIKGRERDLMRLEAQQHASGAAGSRALEAILGMDGVYGTIAQLGKATPEFALALDIAAGSRLQYVLVENDAVAADAITYLKENRLGRVTFLPLNKLRAHDLPPLKDTSVIDYALNLLEYDPLYDPAFRIVFGGTVVVETLNQARKMMGKYRMVTLEGDLLEKAGAITGGSRPKKAIGFGVAVDEELKKLRSEIVGLEAEALDLDNAIARLSGEGDERRRERMGIDEQIARFRMLREEFTRQMDLFLEEKAEIIRSLNALLQDVGDGSDKLASVEADLESIALAISEIQAGIDNLKYRLEGTNIPALTQKIEQYQKEIDENERRLRNKDSDIIEVQRERQHFGKRADELEQERSRIEEKNHGIDEEINSLEVRITEQEAFIRDVESRQKKFSAELEELRERRKIVTDTLLSYEKHLMELESNAERIGLQINSLLERQSSLVEEVTRLREEAGEAKTDLSLQEIVDGIEAAEGNIKKIGAVNMLAIEEYDRVQGRITERTEKKEVLSRERTLIMERIEKYERMKFHSFMESFRAIDTNFRKIFAQLTSGSGRLILDSEEDPFIGGMTFAVQPRDKKVHLLSSLSGGEKSLTTLAFIFAIQQYMPAPFYALDEIDMFLDSSNVERIATMIKELSTGAQSIIVSLRKPTIERADQIVGVTLLPDKNSYVTGLKANG